MEKTYQNPVAVKGDFADPFVLRYNGRYYLYSTTPQVLCWSSANLTDWQLEGPAILEGTFPELVPFAPEVVYSNGKFYMYTSPSGFGHYVLESNAPTGPFHKISDNIQHAIDGSVFIDDDGKWYFYWAGDEGIWGCEMKSPTEFGTPVFTGASMYGWTEGPFVCKKNGIYYMTYTGNHYLSKGYRINGAWSTDPLKGYQDEVYNPMIIHTQDDVVGLGHSSTVMGPNLVSHYIVYHNMNEDLTRHMDIDRQLMAEHVIQILGPTRTVQQAPAMADYIFQGGEGKESDWNFIRGDWECKEGICYGNGKELFALTKQKFSSDFTAEFHIMIPQGESTAHSGILLGEEDNFYSLVFKRDVHTLELQHQGNDGTIVLQQSQLEKDHIFETLHCIRVEYRQNCLLSVFVDNRLCLQEEKITLPSVSLGYFSEDGQIGCGFTAITESTYEKEAELAVIPANCSFYPVFGKGICKKNLDGSILLKEDQGMEYQLSADETTEYTLYITSKGNNDSSQAEIIIDNKKSGIFTGGQRLSSLPVQLTEGRHTLKVHVKSGEFLIKRLNFIHVSNGEKKELNFPAEAGTYGKKLFGRTSWSNYTVSARMKADFRNADSKAGLLIRVTEPSEGGEGEDPVLGIHFFIGYSISFTGKELVVSRHRYDEKILGTCPFRMEADRFYEICVEVQGDEISVCMEGESEPVLIVKDTEPITHGCPGIWAKDSVITVERADVSM